MGKRKYHFLFVLVLFFLLFLTGCNNKMGNDDVKIKTYQELEYLDSKIINIANKLNNISLQGYTISSEEVALGEEGSSSEETSGKQGGNGSGSGEQQKQSNSQNGESGQNNKNNITVSQMEQKTVLASDKNDINWNNIKSDIETINEVWSVVVLDLSNFNVNSEDILGFSTALDDCILNIRDENKIESLTNIAKLYSYIPKIEKTIPTEKNSQNIKQVKSNIINAYSLVEKEDWINVETNMNECEEIFANLLNDLEYIKNKEYKVKKTYIAIKELQNSLAYKDKDLFYVKYKNLMESVGRL